MTVVGWMKKAMCLPRVTHHDHPSSSSYYYYYYYYYYYNNNRGPNGAAAGVGAQHSQEYSGWYSSVPGLKVSDSLSGARGTRVVGAIGANKGMGWERWKERSRKGVDSNY